MKRIFYIAAVMMLALQVAAQTDSIPKEGPTEDPFNLDPEVSRGYYGPDDRKDVTDADGFDDFVRATAAMVDVNDVHDGYIEGETLREQLSRRYGTDRFNENVNFLDQPACSYCTGFLIAPDMLVTAGHCIEKMSDCEGYAWVFDYTAEKNFSDGKLSIDNRDVYYCDDILTTTLVNGGGDWAVIRLKEPSDRDPYRFRISGKIADNMKIYMIGAPSGLPLKLADNAYVRDNDDNYVFEATLDAFGGNSGGPVFDRAGWIEGILVSGLADYEYDQWTDQVRVAVHSEDLDKAEQVMRITGLPRDLLLEAIYNNIEYGIRNNDMRRLQKWLIYGGITEHPYTITRGRFEDIAIEVNNVEALQLLAANTEELKVGDESGRGLLYYAIANDHLEYLDELLLSYSPNKQDNKGMSPVFWAVELGKYEALAMLVENGADLSLVENERGETVLHHAVRSGDLKAVEMLIDAGADLDVENSDGKNACRLARSLKEKEIKKVIRAAEKAR